MENIDTLQELLDLVKKEKNPIIILNYNYYYIDNINEPIDFTIEIYNGYRE